MNNKGIAFETLAKIAIAVLILVSITVFFTVGMQRLGSQFVSTTPQGTALSSAQAQCRTNCLSLNNVLSDVSNARTQPYCTATFKLQEDGNPNNDDKCYDNIITIGTPCAVTLTNGRDATIDKTACQGGNFGQVSIGWKEWHFKH